MGPAGSSMAWIFHSPIIFLPFLRGKSGKMAQIQDKSGSDAGDDHPDQKDKEGWLMLTGLQLFNKMKSMAKDFYTAYYAKQYAKAWHIYIRVHTAALMNEFDQDWMAQLFGNRPFIPDDEAPVEGMFPSDMVQKVSDFCVIHHITMDELHLHPREPGILHDEQDCITKVCTRRHPEGIPIYNVMRAKK